MVLTLDVGNTNIVMSVYDGDKLKFTSRMATQSSKMEDEYAVSFMSILKLYSCEDACFEGAIVSSVVPPLVPILTKAVESVFGCRCIVVSAGIKTGINIKLDNPAILGADLVCGAVGALNKYSMPCIIFDLGTATTVSAMDKSGGFLGGSIFPGVNVSMRALTDSTAQLPHINPNERKVTTIGTNTVDAMRSGIILGTASMIDGMTERYKQILGEEATVIITGGFSTMIAPHCHARGIIVDETLLSDGLYLLYKMNTKNNG